MKQLRIASAILLAACALSTPVWAEKGGHGKGHSKKHSVGHEEQLHISISRSDRRILQDLIAEDYRSHCPPGLAKKRNGCLPPGQAKKRYSVGQPYRGEWEAIPSSWLGRLGPVPAGYRYVRVDQDVLLMSEASHHVIDAITLMSAVGN